MHPSAIDDHPYFLARFTEGRHHWMEVLTQLLGIKVRYHCIEDLGGAIVDRADDAEQHSTRDATPRAILPACLAFEGLLAVELPLAQRACGEARGAVCPRPARGSAKRPRRVSSS
jgi:hypothetical protein